MTLNFYLALRQEEICGDNPLNINQLFIQKYNKISYIIMTYFTCSTVHSAVMKFCTNSQANQLSQTHLAQN